MRSMYSLHSFCLSSKELRKVWNSWLVHAYDRRLFMAPYGICKQNVLDVRKDYSDSLLI